MSASARPRFSGPKKMVGLGCLLLIAAGVAWRWQTVLHGGDYRYSWGSLGYSDVVQLYVLRNFAAHQIPYLQQPFEYPVLTGITIWLTGYIPGLPGYYLANAVLLGGAGLATFCLLARVLGPRALARYALAPGLALYVTLNWDMLSLLALTAGLLFASRRRFGWCGLAIGTGAAYKLYPAFTLPVLLALSLAEDGRVEVRRFRETMSLVAGVLTPILAFNVPVALMNASGWSYFWTFQSGRAVDPDAIWAHLSAGPDGAITRTFTSIFLVGVVWLAVRVYLNRGGGWLAASFASVLFFLIATRDYSPQYDVWLLPFLAFLICPWPLWSAFVVADLFYYAAIFLFLYPGFGWPAVLHQPALVLGLAVWMREVALGALLAWAIYRIVMPGAPYAVSRGARAVLPLSTAGCALVATVFGGAIAVRQSGAGTRDMILWAEAALLTVGLVVAGYRQFRHNWRDSPIYMSGSLVPLLAVILVDFGGIGSFLVPGFLLAAASAAESWCTQTDLGGMVPKIGNQAGGGRPGIVDIK